MLAGPCQQPTVSGVGLEDAPVPTNTPFDPEILLCFIAYMHISLTSLEILTFIVPHGQVLRNITTAARPRNPSVTIMSQTFSAQGHPQYLVPALPGA